MRTHSDQYKEIFLNNLPLADVRAPVEFAKGAFPQAVNLPLMDDEERRQVGIRYKQQGQQAAIDLGHSLVNGALKARRIAAWTEFARKHPDGHLYCFRGGLRSQIAQQWLKEEAGIDYPRVPGGYKAMRNFLIETTVAAQEECGFILVGGLTGTGKTELLEQLDNAIDLEGHAHHRGSSFGKHATPQPGQIDFENALAIDFLKKRAQGHQVFVVEDEGRMIGHCALPQALCETMRQHPLIWVEDSLSNRTERILRDYVVNLCAEFVGLHDEEPGFDAFAEHLRLSLHNIRKRLGMERYQRLAAIMDEALAEQRRSALVDGHRTWIEALLVDYYDPMYTHQHKSRAARIVFRGDRQAVTEYLQSQTAQTRT